MLSGPNTPRPTHPYHEGMRLLKPYEFIDPTIRSSDAQKRIYDALTFALTRLDAGDSITARDIAEQVRTILLRVPSITAENAHVASFWASVQYIRGLPDRVAHYIELHARLEPNDPTAQANLQCLRKSGN